jgi:nucleoside-diphosphate-sugar epimerase
MQQEDAMSKTVLIAGANGHFGRAAAVAFGAAGWQVRRYQRGGDMAAAAQGADVIVNALNPPNYANWVQNIPAITSQVIAAARASGARVVVPGNVYVYGTAPAPWGPGTPQRPHTRKGQIRAQMEAAYRASGVRTLILRGGDFIDPAAGRTMFAMMTSGLARGKITRFGDAGAAHAYAYLPDMARAAAALVDHPELPDFADIPFAGLTFSPQDLQAEAARQLGRPVRLARFGWWMMHIAAPFWELAREFLEMRYLSSHPHSLDPALMAALLPQFQGTSLAQVVAEALAAQRPQAQGHGQVMLTQTGR